MNKADKRCHCVSTRMSKAELEVLDRKRDGIQRGAYLRACFFSNAPAQVPEVNKHIWQKLARSASNLNQIAIKLNIEHHVEMSEVMNTLRDFRIALISHKSS